MVAETGPAFLAAEESAALGRLARAAAPRSGHAELPPDADRPDPVDLLESQAASRVPELVPIRYGRMASSPFAYFRGAALAMAAEPAGTPTSGITVQACGDAHLLNFGLYASPERRLVFDRLWMSGTPSSRPTRSCGSCGPRRRGPIRGGGSGRGSGTSRRPPRVRTCRPRGGSPGS